MQAKGMSAAKKLIIAIDGPAGSGKSTTAKRVAERLGLLYIDTGAMYRAATLKVLEEGVALDDEHAISELMDQINIDLQQVDGQLKVFLDGVDVSDAIRSPEVTRSIAPVCAMAHVREVLVRKQREMGRNGGVVMEGRDIGTVVFPEADLKVYLTASIQERAKRRYRELKRKGIDMPLDRLEQEIATRDRTDQERDLAPLRQAPDALVIDTTDLTIDEQVERIIALAEDRQAFGA